MSSLYIVVGTYDMGNNGNAILGVYPSLKLAKERIKFVTSEESDHGFEDVVYYIVKNYNPETGKHTNIALESDHGFVDVFYNI